MASIFRCVRIGLAIAEFRSTFFIVIGTRARRMKMLPLRNRRIGLDADGCALRCKDVARSARRCSRLWFGVIRMTAKRAKLSCANSVNSFARVDELARFGKDSKSQQEAGGRARLAMTNFRYE